MNSVAVIAGSISTALFVVSALPMLYKAARIKELGSYSLGYLALANIGNANRADLGAAQLLHVELGADAVLVPELRGKKAPSQLGKRYHQLTS